MNNVLTVITDNDPGEKAKWHIGLTADSVEDLVGHLSDLAHGIRQEAVCFQKVKGAERQQLERDAHMAVVVKPVQHLHTVPDGTELQR